MSKRDQKYAQIMENHPFGVALFHPPPSGTFKPGMCGFFNEFGAWNPICDLLDTKGLEARGIGRLEEPLERAPIEENIRWGPLLSSDMKGNKVDLTAGVAPYPGIPVTASAVFEYSTEKDTGAILLTTLPITHDRFYYSTPFKSWVKKNAQSILFRYPDVQDHQLWIVTSVYMTKSCSINMWEGRGKSFTVGVSADAMGVGQAGAGREWHHSRKDHGWAEYSPPDDQQSVVFFSGLVFKYRRSWFGKERLKQKDVAPLYGSGLFRGTEELTSFVNPNQPEEKVTICCNEIFEESDMFSDSEDED